MVDAGEIGSGHQVTALFELALSQSDLPNDLPASDAVEANSEEARDIPAEDLVRVRLRWKKPGEGERDEASEALFSLARDALLDDASELDADAVWAVGIASLAEVLRESPYTRDVDLAALGKLLAPLVGKSSERSELMALWPKAVQFAPR